MNIIYRLTKLSLVFIGILLFSVEGFSQSVGISNATFTPNTESVLELKSDSKGALLPRMTTTDRDNNLTGLGATEIGLTIFNTTEVAYQFWNGTAWISLGTAGASDNDWTEVGADLERQSGDVYIGDAASTNNDLYVSDDIVDWDNSTYFLDMSSTSRINKIEFSDASVTSPAVQFDGDGNSGLYQPADNQIGVSINGNQLLRYQSAGIAIGGNADDPYSYVDIVGSEDGSVLNALTLRNDHTTAGTTTTIRLINSTSSTSITGGEIQAVRQSVSNGESDLVFKVHGTGAGSGALEERLRIKGDGDVVIGSDGYRGKLGFYADDGAAGGTDYTVTFAPSAATTANLTYTLPPDGGASDYVLRTDGAGVLTWVDPASISDGDWDVDGSDVRRSTGNVYIGGTSGSTSSPNVDLYISREIIDGDNTTYKIDPSGSNTRINEIQFDDGTVTDPSIWFESDANSGFFQPNNNEVAVTTDGVQRVTFKSDGSVGIGTDSPASVLEVWNDAGTDPFLIRTVKNSNNASELSGIGFGSEQSFHHVKSGIVHERVDVNGVGHLHFLVDDVTDANDVALTDSRMTILRDGKVGIGTTVPTNELDVDGQIRMRTGATNGYLPVSNANGVMTWTDPTTLSLDVSTASNGLTESSDDIQLGGALTQATTITQGANNLVFNLDGTGEFDVQDGGTSALFVQNDGFVGISNNAPTYELDVAGDVGIDNELVHNDDTHTKLTFTPDRIQFFAGHSSDTWIDMQHSAEEMAINEQGRSRDLRVEGDTDANLIMVDGSQDNVGIGGAPDPDIKLDVNGYSAATNQVTIIPLWQAGSNYFMNNTAGQDLSNVESGINPDIYEPNGNLEVKLVVRVTSTSGGTVGNFQLRTHDGTTQGFPIVNTDAWTWATTQSGYVVTSPWKAWAAGTNAHELHVHGWVNAGGQSLNFNSAYLLVRAQQN